jgi:hypothetical protein
MAAAAMAVASLFHGAAGADGLQGVLHYTHGDVVIDLDTYTKGPQIVGLIGMQDGSKSISYAFDKGDITALFKMWDEARALTSDNFESAGTVLEVGSTQRCAISAAGGPGIRLSILDPVKGAVVFDLTEAEASEFDTGLRQVAASTTYTN